MKNLNKYLVHQSYSIHNTLQRINDLPKELTMFVIDNDKRVIGSVTDGDIRTRAYKLILK